MKAATQQVGIPERTKEGWLVPSCDGTKQYRVEQSFGRWECNCDDWWYRRRKYGEICKHIAACLALELDAEQGEEVLMAESD